MSIHRIINVKANAISNMEKRIGRKASILEIQRICGEWYGAYFKY